MSNSRTVNGPGFRIRYEDRPGYLRAHVFDGTDSPQVSVAMWRMLGSEFQAVGAQRMLVLEDLQATVEAQDSVSEEALTKNIIDTGFQVVGIQ